MQDKEFDQLFRDRFENAEVQPAAGLWNNIAEELEPKRRGRISFYWMSAAAIAALIVTVGLLNPKSEKIRLRAPLASAGLKKEQGIPGADTVTVSAKENAIKQASRINVSTPLVIAPRITEKEIQSNFAALQPRQQITHPVIKLPEVKDELRDETIPANEVMIASADVAAANYNEGLTAEAGSQEHKGIRNVGDLINFVVNKVDKRENKIVQFDTDDDNSSLVSLNLGIIRFNKKSNK